MNAVLIFPHQLFASHPGIAINADLVVLTEDPLFFGDQRYPLRFHRQKLLLHRASMQYYARRLRSQGVDVHYRDFASGQSAIGLVLSDLHNRGVTALRVCDVADFVLARRLRTGCEEYGIALNWLPSPGFINTDNQNTEYRSSKKRWFMADFYKWQRRRLNILIDDEDQPQGGQWSFDEENRKKIPKKSLPELSQLNFAPTTDDAREAATYLEQHFADPIGNGDTLLYPATHEQAVLWLRDFLDIRFARFGPYEDAIVEDQNWLFHSVLTPALNIGLLTPQQVIDESLQHANKHDIPIASIEGFVRQIIGWREFMRATYVDIGVTLRNGNHWQHQHAMPDAFYNATTGVLPVDNAIQRVLDTGYCHHIERLMILGGFMFLCEIKPEAIYQWFMELFVDSYDWVMVPNVYAMSQNADGGLITTKPYFSGSNYVRKMSHYPVAPWCDIWDALYWRWIIRQSSALAKNPRWSMMVRNAEKMDTDKKEKLLKTADQYLKAMHG